MRTYTVCVSSALCPFVLTCFAQGFKKQIKISVTSVDEPQEDSFYISCKCKDPGKKIHKKLKGFEKAFEGIPGAVFVLCD